VGKKYKKKANRQAKIKKLSTVDWLKQNIVLCLILLACLTLPFITSSTLLDQSLLSKFLALSILLSFATLFICFSKKTSFFFSVVDILFGSYVLFSSYLIIKWIFLNNRNSERYILPVFAFTAFVLVFYGWFEFFTSGKADGTNKIVYAVKGFAAHKNLFVLQLFLHLPFLIIGYLKSTTKFKYFYAINAILVLLLLISLLARAFMVGLVVTIITAIFLWFISRNNEKSTFNWKPVAFSLPVLFVIIISIFSLRGDVEMLNRYNIFNFKDSRNAQERFALWSNTLELIKDQPILGLGAGNWDVFFPSTGIEDIRRMAISNKTVSRPHNDYLWITAETGIIGIALYLSILIAIYFITIKSILHLKDNPIEKTTLIVLLSFFTGYLVIAFFDFPKERTELNFMVATIMVFTVYSIYRNNQQKVLFSLQDNGARILSFFLFLILCSLVYVGSVRYFSEQKTGIVRHHFRAERFDKILHESPGIKNILYNIDPTEAPVKYYECFAHFGKKDYKEAIVPGEEALLDSPYHVTTLKKLAAAYGELMQYEKAIPYFERVFQINPTDMQNKEGLVMCYYNSDQKDKAKALLNLLEVTEKEHPSITEMRRIFGLN